MHRSTLIAHLSDSFPILRFKRSTSRLTTLTYYYYTIYINAIWKGSNTSGWVLYTDASRSTHGVLWGFVVFHSGLCVYRDYGSLSNCTIFAAKAYALLEAIYFVKEMKNLNRKEEVEIRSDSQGLIKAICSQEVTDLILVKIKKALKDVHSARIKLSFRWVPCYKGVLGNETTDCNLPDFMPCTQRDIKRFLKERERALKKKSWDVFASRNVKFFLPNVTMLQSFIKASPSRVLCQIISGHTRLNAFVCEKLGLIRSSIRKCNKDKEIVSRFLFDCSLYDELRSEIWPDFDPTYQFITQEWDALNQFVIKSKRFENTVRSSE